MNLYLNIILRNGENKLTLMQGMHTVLGCRLYKELAQ